MTPTLAITLPFNHQKIFYFNLMQDSNLSIEIKLKIEAKFYNVTLPTKA